MAQIFPSPNGSTLNLPNPLPVSSTDGALATVGTTTDSAVSGDSSGTVLAQLRGINFALSQLTVDLHLTNQLLLKILLVLQADYTASPDVLSS